MALTKNDLQAIRGIVKSEIEPVIKDLKKGIKKDIKKVDKKVDRFFNFLDKDCLRVKTDVGKIQKHLDMPVSDF